MHYLVGFFILAILAFSPAPTSAEETSIATQEETPKVEIKEAVTNTNTEQTPVEETEINTETTINPENETEIETEAADDYYYADYDYDYENYNYDNSDSDSYYANDFQSAGVIYSDNWR